MSVNEETKHLTAAVAFALSAIVETLEKSGHIDSVKLAAKLLVISELLDAEKGSGSEIAKKLLLFSGLIVAGTEDPPEAVKTLH